MYKFQPYMISIPGKMVKNLSSSPNPLHLIRFININSGLENLALLSSENLTHSKLNMKSI